ncbi:MAG: ABC transporter ATP-binding protein [Dehalococcoidia bacterium]|nr:ABC transporter ATP-binding protein [Dehalococcoidia bacterium]MCB9486090.1 ABC transporter ATP-binding protein [Thermoflexaceae bacterium]
MTAASIEVRGVTRLFKLGSEDVQALQGIDISVEPRQFVALIGRSGSGKTTLLNIIAGLDRPTTGEVYLDGNRIDNLSERDLTKLRRRDMGFIFQSFGLLPLLSAQENVELPLRIAGFGHGDRTRMARSALDLVGLTRRANHRPYELSGGEQQRVAIARAIATGPRLILADEPTGELDSTTARIVFNLLRALSREQDFTVVTCTHDRLVMDMADRVEELVDGRLVAPGEGELWKRVRETARSPFEAAFVGAPQTEESASGLSSLVGADTTAFAKPERPAAPENGTNGTGSGQPEGGAPADEADSTASSPWARPQQRS